MGPVIGEDGLLGILQAGHKRKGAFGEDELRLIGSLAGLASIAVSNARLADKLAASQATLERTADAERALREIARRMMSSQDPAGLLQDVTQEAASLGQFLVQEPLKFVGTLAVHGLAVFDQDFPFTYVTDLNPWYRWWLAVPNYLFMLGGVVGLLVGLRWPPGPDPEQRRRSRFTLGVVGAERMALGDGRDSRVPGRRVQLGQRRRLRELPGKRVLAATRSQDENAHRASLVRRHQVACLRGRSRGRALADRLRRRLDVVRRGGDRRALQRRRRLPVAAVGGSRRLGERPRRVVERAKLPGEKIERGFGVRAHLERQPRGLRRLVVTLHAVRLDELFDGRLGGGARDSQARGQ